MPASLSYARQIQCKNLVRHKADPESDASKALESKQLQERPVSRVGGKCEQGSDVSFVT